MRNSNIELCRLISMVMVVLLHSCYSANGWPTTLNMTTAALSLVECFSIIAVNVFVLITGYFSTTLKRLSLINFIFIVLFYGIVKILFQLLTESFEYSSLFVFTNQNWFILCYLCLVLLSPIANEWIKHTDKYHFKKIIILLFILQTITDFIPGIGGIFNRGCSPLSFFNIYLLGRYAKIYGGGIIFRCCKLIYFSSSLFLFSGCLVILYYRLPQVALYHWLYYSNPIIVLSALSFFAIFANMKARSNSYINHIAKSCLAILLLHVPLNSPMWYSMKTYYQDILNSYSNVFPIILLWIIGIIAILVTSIAIDQIRLSLWRNLEKLIIKYK